MSTPADDLRMQDTADWQELSAAVHEYLDVQLRIEQDIDRKNELAAVIAKFLPAGQRYEVAEGVGVQMTEAPRRFDPTRADKLFTAAQLAEISVPTVSATLAKRLYPVLFEAAKSAGKPSLRRI